MRLTDLSEAGCSVPTHRPARRFLLDLARFFPPESFEDTPHLPRRGNTPLYRIFRPEFMRYLG
jgi:hypothetical protein